MSWCKRHLHKLTVSRYCEFCKLCLQKWHVFIIKSSIPVHSAYNYLSVAFINTYAVINKQWMASNRKLLVAKGLDGVEVGGFLGRVPAEKDTDGNTDHKTNPDGEGADYVWP